jgi:hypothetical protein
LRLLRRLASSLLLQKYKKKKTSIINKGLCRSIVSASHQFSPEKCNCSSLPPEEQWPTPNAMAAALITLLHSCLTSQEEVVRSKDGLALAFFVQQSVPDHLASPT